MIQRTRLPWTRSGYPHAQIHLPPLTAQEALLIANLLDRAIAALWRAHGHAMTELLASCDPDAALPTEPDHTSNPEPKSNPSDDDLF